MAPRRTSWSLHRAALLAASLALAATACSSGDETSESSPATTSTPATQAPSTEPPATEPPATEPPATEPPATEPPATEPPATDPPVTTLPSPVADVAIVTDLPAQPDGVPFPDEEWPTADLPAGVDVAVLDAAAAAAFREGTDSPEHVRSLIVVQAGAIVHEAYHPAYDENSVNQSYSVAKSMASAGIGLLVGDGLVELDTPAPVATWSDPADPRHAITVLDLLNMASGLEWLEVYTPGSAPSEMFAAPDASDSAAGRPLVADPGTQFNYSTGTTAILAQIITDAAWAAEIDAPVDPAAEPDAAAGVRFMEERLFDPIGITTAQLMTDPEGTWMGGLGADMTTRDFARFGLLFMRDGVWDGERILPEGWVQYSFTPSAASAGYGAQWWLDAADGRFSARGLFGQNIVLVPELDLIVVTNSSQGGPVEPLIDAVIAEFASAP